MALEIPVGMFGPMRAHDLAAMALAGVAVLVVVQATWVPPTIAPGEAHEHVGQRVRVEGMVTDVTMFPDGAGRLRLAADGHGLLARFDAPLDVQRGAWVTASGSVEQRDGLPLLRIESLSTGTPPATPRDDMDVVAAAPQEHLDRLLRLSGDLDGPRFTSEGHTVRLAQSVAARGPHDVVGVLGYEASCLCHTFLVHEARPWTP